MLKKILPFLCSLAPLYAFGADEIDILPNPSSIILNENQYANVTSGTGVNVGSDGVNVYNINVLNTAESQLPTATHGDLYIINTAGTPFGIASSGEILVRNNITVEATRGLQLSGPVVMTVDGSISADGAFAVSNATSFTSGSILSADSLSITAGQITTGFISSSDGDTTVIATGALDIGGIMASALPSATTEPTTKISGASVNAGSVQNLAGNMTITSGGVFASTGNVENSGNLLKVDATGNMTVAGTLKNDLVSGTINITANSLTVSGSDAINNASFVNSGDAVFNITGALSFVHGMNLENMAATSGLQITTGTLNLGTNNIIANDKSYVNIDVTGGALNAGTISNGVDGGSSNASAIMVLKGVGVNLASVQNYGSSLTIDTYDTSAINNVTITGGFIGAVGTITNVTAADLLSVGGNIVNSGNMTLNGANVSLSGVSNSGAGSTLNISAPTNDGVLRINGALVNSDGTTTVVSKDLAIGAVTNNSGVLNISASDTSGNALSVASIAVNGGAMNLNAWAGNIETGSLDVALGGVLNLGNAVHNVDVNGTVNIARNVNLASAAASGNGDLYLTSNSTTITSVGNITVGGNIIATDNTARAAQFDGPGIYVNGDVGVNVVGGGNFITFGSGSSASELSIANALSVTNSGSVEVYSGTSSAKSLTESGNAKIMMHGTSFTATNGDVSIADGLFYGVPTTVPAVGVIIDGNVATFGLTSTTSDVIINNGIGVGENNRLNIDAGGDINIASGATQTSGKLYINAANNATFNGSIVTVGDAAPLVSVSAKTINTNAITNVGTVVLSATSGGAGTIQSTALVSNSGALSLTATNNISLANIDSTAGSVTIVSNNANVSAGSFSVSGGTASVVGNKVELASVDLEDSITTITSPDIDVANAVSVAGNIVQGAAISDVSDVAGTLKLVGVTTFDSNTLTITNGGFVVKSGESAYTIAGVADFGSGITIGDENTSANTISTTITADTIEVDSVTNYGALELVTTDEVLGLSLGGVINNSALTITTNGLINAASFVNNVGATAVITSANMTLSGALNIDEVLYQGGSSSGAVNITNNNYTITANNVVVGGITQSGSSRMVINTSDLKVKKATSDAGLVISTGDVSANNLTIVATPTAHWANVEIDGNLSGGVKLYGLEYMTVGGNYLYNNNSLLHAAVLPYADGVLMNSAPYNYWADVSLADDNTLGQITNRSNGADARALVYVGGSFASDISTAGTVLEGSPLVTPEVGINLYSIVDQGSAIWLLYAKEGVSDLATKIRNLNVNFCNADGSICFNYLDSYNTDDLPIYLSVRDYNNDGVNDSLYIVFDPRFGGPVKVFDTESIVNRVEDKTDGEISASNALDQMVAGQLNDKGFYNNTPIEAIPLAFAGTNLEELANELYDRMERYVVERDGTALARFARLVQPRELEQIAEGIALNEHTSFRDFEDRMFDEFIWNRNRNLSRAWFDADFGMFRQEASDDKVMTGNRFNISAGFDWKNSSRTILGLMARVSRMSSENSDFMDLSYMPGQYIAGHNHMNVIDTDIGIGGYMLQTLGTKARLYGNAMFDLHLINLTREQNYVAEINGSGTAYSLISEWGLLHDWLNQYIVGNAYARLGYNFGFNVKEDAAGSEYMHLMSDGYFIFVPGYSLIAQKRIYPSPWFQVRPYASIGIEYDVLGMPDVSKYKFAPSKSYTEYNTHVDPLWANIGGGIELLSAIGIQAGLDYRYQYNNDIQLHNIRLSGSVRF